MTDTMKLREFREAMIAQGMLVDEAKTDDDGRAENSWRARHLTAMAMLVHASNPELPIDGTTTSASLYEALAQIVPLNESVVYTLEEILEALDVSEAEQESPSEGTSSEIYAEELKVSIEGAAKSYPWRVGAERDTFTRKELVGPPPPKSVAPSE